MQVDTPRVEEFEREVERVKRMILDAEVWAAIGRHTRERESLDEAVSRAIALANQVRQMRWNLENS